MNTPTQLKPVQPDAAPARWPRAAQGILFVIGWLALLVASNSPLLAAVQLIGIGLGALVSVRLVQEWARRR